MVSQLCSRACQHLVSNAPLLDQSMALVSIDLTLLRQQVIRAVLTAFCVCNAVYVLLKAVSASALSPSDSARCISSFTFLPLHISTGSCDLKQKIVQRINRAMCPQHSTYT